MSRWLTIFTTSTLTYLLLYVVFTSVFLSSGTYENVEPIAMNDAVLSYLRGPVFMENPLTFLPEQEYAHMTDVKRVFDITFLLFLVSFGTLLGIFGMLAWHRMWSPMEELFGKSLRNTGFVLLGFCFFFGLAAVLNFNVFWTLFHVFLFPLGNWMFSSDSILITLYPTSFFLSFLLTFGIRVLAVGLLATIVGLFIMRMRVHESFFNRKTQKARKARTKQ